MILYADDICAMFDNLVALQECVPIICKHLLRCGLRMHYEPIGSNNASKSVCMWFPTAATARTAQQQPPLQPIYLRNISVNGTDFPDGTVAFTEKQKYLGTMLSSQPNDDIDIEARISAAARSFGALSFLLRSTKFSTKAKKPIFIMCVVSTLLHGSENWTGKEINITKLTSFFNNCIRAMLRISKWKQWKAHTTTADLLRLMDINHLRYYIDQRALRWLGHVQRMNPNRLPKRLLYSWIPDRSRTRGGQTKTLNRRFMHLLVDMANTLPNNLASLMRQELADTQSSTPAPRLSWRASNNKTRDAWLQCSTWTNLANDRNLWKQATKEYLRLKIYE